MTKPLQLAARDEQALRRAIMDAPYDNAPRLAYADWLEKQAAEKGRHGRSERDRAEFIRVQCRLSELCDVSVRSDDEALYAAACLVPEIKALKERQEALLGEYVAEWANDDLAGDHLRRAFIPDHTQSRWRGLLTIMQEAWFEPAQLISRQDKGLFEYACYRATGKEALEVDFDRGFVDTVTCSLPWFVAHNGAWLDRVPLARLELHGVPEAELDAWERRILQHPRGKMIDSLVLEALETAEVSLPFPRQLRQHAHPGALSSAEVEARYGAAGYEPFGIGGSVAYAGDDEAKADAARQRIGPQRPDGSRALEGPATGPAL